MRLLLWGRGWGWGLELFSNMPLSSSINMGVYTPGVFLVTRGGHDNNGGGDVMGAKWPGCGEGGVGWKCEWWVV